MSLHSAAAVDLARHLIVPFMGTARASERKLLDTQAGIDASLQVLLSALSGASLVHDVGFLDCADIDPLPYLIRTDEIIAMVKRILRGILISTETIKLDLIEKVGPGSLFLKEGRSASLCRNEPGYRPFSFGLPTPFGTKPGAGRSNNGYLKSEIRFSRPTNPPLCQGR